MLILPFKLLEHIVEKGKCGLEENFTAPWCIVYCVLFLEGSYTHQKMWCLPVLLRCVTEYAKQGQEWELLVNYAENIICLCGVRVKSRN